MSFSFLPLKFAHSLSLDQTPSVLFPSLSSNGSSSAVSLVCILKQRLFKGGGQTSSNSPFWGSCQEGQLLGSVADQLRPNFRSFLRTFLYCHEKLTFEVVSWLNYFFKARQNLPEGPGCSSPLSAHHLHLESSN